MIKIAQQSSKGCGATIRMLINPAKKWHTTFVNYDILLNYVLIIVGNT